MFPSGGGQIEQRVKCLCFRMGHWAITGWVYCWEKLGKREHGGSRREGDNHQSTWILKAVRQGLKIRVDVKNAKCWRVSSRERSKRESHYFKKRRIMEQRPHVTTYYVSACISLHVCVELFTTFNPFSTQNQEEVDGLRKEAGRIRVCHKEMDGGLPIVWGIFSYSLCLEMLPKLHRTKTIQYLTRVLMLNILDLMYICFWMLTIALKNRWLISSCIEFTLEKWIF